MWRCIGVAVAAVVCPIGHAQAVVVRRRSWTAYILQKKQHGAGTVDTIIQGIDCDESLVLECAAGCDEMDLRAMLNDSSDRKDAPKQPPRLYTSHSHSSSSDRPPSLHDRQAQPQSAYAADSRSAGSGYFPSPSPAQQNSATASTSSYSYHSPGPYTHATNSRENSTPHVGPPPNYIPSPASASTSASASVNPYPSTPVSAYPHQHQHQPQQPHLHPHPHPQQTSSYGAPSSSQPPLQQRPQTREGPVNANGVPPGHPHHMSPPSHYHQAPSTPLGPPPTAYPRASPHSQRPPSQGCDGYRRSSVSSVGSAHSRDYGVHPMSHPALSRDGSAQRTASGDEGPPREQERERERERSFESVSPKTIPRPPPRQSTASYSQEPPSAPAPGLPNHPLTSLASLQTHPPRPSNSTDRQSEPHQPPSVYPDTLLSGPSDSRAHSAYSAQVSSSMTPQSMRSSLPPQPSPIIKKEAQSQPSLKRNASVISTTPAIVMPPKKRLKRDEIPVWARSARGTDCKPVRFDTSPADSRPSRPDRLARHESVVRSELAPQAPTNGQPHPQQPTASAKWEESILNNIPHEDLIRSICDWIYLQVGQRQPPPGAVFEIEAKVGQIIDTREHNRLRLPVKTETIFDKETFWNSTKFESTMTLNQHKFMNEWLNQVTHESFREAHTTNPVRECLRSQHTVEKDEFFDLSAQGVQELDPSYHQYLPRGRLPRVRQTTNLRTNEVTNCIIKSRIADLEVYNPHFAFDYRISINLEAPWAGSRQNLTLVQDPGATDRSKDRVSYRHLAYQIDLTQISHAGTDHQEHELEVEISVDETKKEIENLVNGRPNRYEQLVHGFINNVRILCRKGQ